MNAPEPRRRPTRKPGPASGRRRSKAFLAELRRQCRLANKADGSDNWRPAMSAVKIDTSLPRALQARGAQGEDDD